MFFFMSADLILAAKLAAKVQIVSNIPANIYSFKVNNKTTRKRCEICSELTIKTPKRRQW